MTTFVHRGDIGDIIAALPVIRAMGGGRLSICPPTGKNQGRESMKGKRFDALKPLLEEQEYIGSVEWSETPIASDMDFSDFRAGGNIRNQSLAHWQAEFAGVTISAAPWLNTSTMPGISDRIIVVRSPRYQNWSFPWQRIVAENRERLLFVGLPDEHKAFCDLLGKIEYLPTANMLEVAQAIAGSQLLIANQTASCWVGLGIGHPLIQEQSPTIPDSVIHRENAQYCRDAAMPTIPRSSISVASKQNQPTRTSQMTIVFPCYNGDIKQATALAESIRDHGAGTGFQCLLLCPLGTEKEEVESILRDAFDSVEVHQYGATLNGWPQGPNEMFAEAAMLISADPRFNHYLWLEPDCVIRNGSVFSEIEQAYLHAGAPIMGTIVDTVHMDTRHVAGKHVIGVAVYPKNFAQWCPLIRSIKSMSSEYNRSGNVPMAFDAYLGNYTASRCAETPLIQHLWRSGEFTEIGGVITAGKTVSPGVDNVVRPDALLLHGCKDDSLRKVLCPHRSADFDPTDRKSEAKLQRQITETLQPVAAPILLRAAKVPDPELVMAAAEPAPSEDPDQRPIVDGIRQITQYIPPKRGAPQAVPKELWNHGEDGLPCVPFLPGQHEFRRYFQLLAWRLEPKNGHKKLVAYAKNNLKLNTIRMTSEKLCEACVVAERTMRKEQWVLDAYPKKPKPPVAKPTPESAPIPQSVTPVQPAASPWVRSDEPLKEDGGIPEHMKAKYLALRQRRGMTTEAGA